MATSEAAICNIALLRIGVNNPIDDLNEQTSEAKACKAVYAHSRDALLSMYWWPFATSTASLSLIAASDPDELGQNLGFGFTYALPVDLVLIRQLWAGERHPPPDWRIPFMIGGGGEGGVGLICDHDTTKDGQLWLEYTARVTNTTRFPHLFADALAWKIAADVAMGLAVAERISARAAQSYELAVSRAAASAMSEPIDLNPESEIITERGYDRPRSRWDRGF